MNWEQDGKGSQHCKIINLFDLVVYPYSEIWRWEIEVDEILIGGGGLEKTEELAKQSAIIALNKIADDLNCVLEEG